MGPSTSDGLSLTRSSLAITPPRVVASREPVKAKEEATMNSLELHKCQGAPGRITYGILEYSLTLAGRQFVRRVPCLHGHDYDAARHKMIQVALSRMIPIAHICAP